MPGVRSELVLGMPMYVLLKRMWLPKNLCKTCKVCRCMGHTLQIQSEVRSANVIHMQLICRFTSAKGGFDQRMQNVRQACVLSRCQTTAYEPTYAEV